MKTHTWTPVLFLMPALAVFSCFVLVPVLGSFYMSIFDWTTGRTPTFNGLQHFKTVLNDSVFWRALLNNVAILLGSLAVQLPIAMGLAVLLSYKTRLRTLFRTAFFAPMVMPTIAIAILWMNIYSPVDGPATKLCQFIMGDDFVCHWLSKDSTSPWLPAPALASIFVTICWQYIGFHMVLFMAGISAIPDDYYEAARIDGANEWQILKHVTLPAIKPTIILSGTLSIIGSLKYFDLIYLMGGALAEHDREVVATYIYRLAFEQGQGRFGQGSATAVVLFIIALAVVLPCQFARHRETTA